MSDEWLKLCPAREGEPDDSDRSNFHANPAFRTLYQILTPVHETPSVLTLDCGGPRFSTRFVPRSTLAAILAGLSALPIADAVPSDSLNNFWHNTQVPSRFYPECSRLSGTATAKLLFYNRLYCRVIFEVSDGS